MACFVGDVVDQLDLSAIEDYYEREEWLRRIAARRALGERAQAEARAEGKDEAEDKQAKPEPRSQHNFTDPESRIMKDRMGSCRPTTRRSRLSRRCS